MVTNAHPADHVTGDSAPQRDLPYIDLVDAQGNVQRSLALGERSVTIGSAPGNLLVLEGSSVARSHVRIDWDGQNAAVQNLATRRPTLYEGAPLQANDLRVWQPGELLQVGDYRLKLRLGGEGGESQTSSASQVTTPLSAIAASAADLNSLLDLRLDTGYDLLELTPDQMVAVKLTLNNRSTTAETVMISVEGPAAAWVRLPPTPVQIRPMGSTPLMLPVTVPRKPENRAGEYEVVIRARGQSNSSNSASAIGRWTVLPFSEARLELRPPTLKLRGTNTALYTVALRNLGNVSMPFELRMTDDQQQLEFAPNLSSGVIEPGATDERKVEVLPLRQPDDTEQTYNVRVQATANGQTYTDSSTLIQRRGGMPPWAVWTLAALFGLALLAIPTLFLAYRANAQNNANGTQVAMVQQTRDSMLTFEERTGTAVNAGTQTVVAQTLQAVSLGVANAPTATVLSQINATMIAGAAQQTAQAVMRASTPPQAGNTTNNNNFFGDGANSPAQATLGAVLQAIQAASGQVSGNQTSQALQAQAGQIAQTSVAQSGQTAAAQSNGTALAQSTSSANTQGTQAAQTSTANAANLQNTQVAQTGVAQTSAAQAAQTAAAQTAAAQTAGAQTAAAQQTQQAQAGQTAAVQTQQAQQTAGAQTPTAAAIQTAAAVATAFASQTSVAATQTATVVQGAQPASLTISSSPSSARAGQGFEANVFVLDRSGRQATTTGNGFVVSMELYKTKSDGGLGERVSTTWGTVASTGGLARFPNLSVNLAGPYLLVATAQNLTASPPVPLRITAETANKFVFKCFLSNSAVVCPGTNPDPFTIEADKPFGFVVEAQDQYGNRDESFQSSSYAKMALQVLAPPNHEYTIGSMPQFNGGQLVINSITMPRPAVGDKKFFFEVGLPDVNAAPGRILTPAFTVKPGAPNTLQMPDPAPTMSRDIFNLPRFQATVFDTIGNPVEAGVIVCFKSSADSGEPDGFFQSAPNRRGRDGVTATTDASGVARTAPFLANNRSGSYKVYAYTEASKNCSLSVDVRNSAPPNPPNISDVSDVTNPP